MIDDTELEERLHDGLSELGMSLPEGAGVTLAKFLLLLDKWNRAFNLTAVCDPREMVTRHVLDSLTVRPYLYGAAILDAGTGAGLPGIPLAVAEPRRQFVLLDSGGKKVRFVRHVVGELGLRNVEVEHSRVEHYDPAEPFDTIVCRAFASLRELVERCAALCQSGGRLVAMKGRMPADELKCLPRGWVATRVEPIRVPGLVGDRHIVVLERERGTDISV